jgi:hypothetical protein
VTQRDGVCTVIIFLAAAARIISHAAPAVEAAVSKM